MIIWQKLKAFALIERIINDLIKVIGIIRSNILDDISELFDK